MTHFSGQTALVAGGGRGYGLRIAQILAAHGANITIVDLNPDRADLAAETIGNGALSIQGDVSNKFQASHMIEATRDTFNTLDILVVNAHVSPSDGILKMDEWNWRRSLEVNVTGAFFMGQLAARVMADEGGGHIIYLIRGDETASTAVKTAEGAVKGLADGMAKELDGTNVCVHVLNLNTVTNLENDLLQLLEERT